MNSRKPLRWLVGITSAVVLALAAIVWSIGAGVRRSGEEAVSRFGGGRVDALAALVECGDCPMRDRNRAVWALGQLGDARVLPLLAKHYSGGRCDHARQLCQYELKKAIRLLEDQNNRMAVLWRWLVSWSLSGNSRFNRSLPLRRGIGFGADGTNWHSCFQTSA